MIKYNNKLTLFLINQLPSTLFILLPIFLVLGSFLSNFSVSYIAIISLIILIKEKKFYFLKNYYFLFFFLFCNYLIVSSIFNGFNLNSFKTSITYFRLGFFVLGIILICNENKRALYYFFIVLLVSMMIVSVDGIYQYVNGINLLGYEYDFKSKRLGGIFKDELIIGSYLLRLFPILLALYIYYDYKILLKYKSLSFLIVFSIVSATIFLSGERLSFFLLIIFFLYIFILSSDLQKTIFNIFIITILSLFTLNFINPNASDRIFKYTKKQLTVTKSQNNKFQIMNLNIFSEHHSQIFYGAYKVYLNNKIFGVGPKNFRIECSKPKYNLDKRSCSTHPHNTYLELLVETGMIGFVFIVMIYFFLIYQAIIFFINKFFFKKKNDDIKVILLGACLINLFPFSTSGSFFSSYMSIFYYLPIAIFGSLYYKK